MATDAVIKDAGTLALFVGVPVLLMLLGSLARWALSSPTERRARACGWTCERSRTRLRFTGVSAGVAWVLERARASSAGDSVRGAFTWSAPCVPFEGLFVVQVRPPSLVRCGQGLVVSPLLTSLTGATLERVSRDSLETLCELDDDADSLVRVYRSAPGHPMDRAAGALRALVEAWPARLAGPLVLWVEYDKLHLQWQAKNPGEPFDRLEALVKAGERAQSALLACLAGGDGRVLARAG